MALIRYSPLDIVVEVSNKTFNNTTIKRKVKVMRLVYSPNELNVTVIVLVDIYSQNPDDTYGIFLGNQPGFSSYQKSMIANMTSLVDATTGAVLGDASLLNDVNSVQTGGALYNKDYMYEFEWYKKVAANTPVVIDNLIISKIQEYDSEGKL